VTLSLWAGLDEGHGSYNDVGAYLEQKGKIV
jgi:hypothetical protein